MKYFIPFIVSLSLTLTTVAFSDDEEGGKPKVGSDMAVTQADSKLGFKLAESAKKRMGVQTQKVIGKGSFSVPSQALVFTRNEVGIYRKREDWFKFISVVIVSKSKSDSKIQSNDLSDSDEVAIAGTGILRVSDIETSSQSDSPSSPSANEKN